MSTLEDMPGDSPSVRALKAQARALMARGPMNPTPRGVPNVGAYRADDPPEKITGADIPAEGVRRQPPPPPPKEPWD
jgi:hypothetical protein